MSTNNNNNNDNNNEGRDTDVYEQAHAIIDGLVSAHQVHAITSPITEMESLQSEILNMEMNEEDKKIDELFSKLHSQHVFNAGEIKSLSPILLSLHKKLYVVTDDENALADEGLCNKYNKLLDKLSEAVQQSLDAVLKLALDVLDEGKKSSKNENLDRLFDKHDNTLGCLELLSQLDGPSLSLGDEGGDIIIPKDEGGDIIIYEDYKSVIKQVKDANEELLVIFNDGLQYDKEVLVHATKKQKTSIDSITKEKKWDTRLNNIAVAILLRDYSDQLRGKYFTWTPGLAEAIKEAYEADYEGKLAVDILSNAKRSWREGRARAARAKLRIGIVKKMPGGAEVGEASTRLRETAAYKADENAASGIGIGPLQTIDMPLEKVQQFIALAMALRNNPSTNVPSDMKQYFPVGDDNLATDGALNDLIGVYQIAGSAYTTDMGLNVNQINAMKHENIGPCVDKFMAENFPKVENGTVQYQEEAGIRKYTLHMIISRLTSVKELLKNGEAFLLPIKVEVEGKQISFNAVFSVGGRRVGSEIERRAIHLDFTICPGMSNLHHGRQSNNQHSIAIADSILFSPTVGIYFDLDSKQEVSKKDFKHSPEYSQYKNITITVDGKKSVMRQIYVGTDKSCVLTLYRINLNKCVNDMYGNRERWYVTHHRANNILASNCGFDTNDNEGKAFLAKKEMRCFEEMYLVTGGSQVAEDLLERSGLDVDLKDMVEITSEKVPQGQCDVDHGFHRFQWISNSIYLCFPMSHTANTCNSIIRRRAGDWCYGLSIRKYITGD